MAEKVIETRGLTVFYGSHRGIVDLDLAVEQGEIFGFLGPNGAGKTTTLRVLLDIIRPVRGTASVFGHDCQGESVAVRQRTGYLPGELSLPRGKTGRRYLETLAAVRGNGDEAYPRNLCQRLNLDLDRRIGEYSQGNKQKLGLVAVERVSRMLEQQFRRFRFTLAETPPSDVFALEGVQVLARDDHSVTVEVQDHLQQVMERAVEWGIVDLEEKAVTLEEIFLAYYGGNGQQTAREQEKTP